MRRSKTHPQTSPGRPLAIDPSAKSASSNLPAFIARPKDAPVYYGFPLLDDVVVEGFTLGKITDFDLEPCNEGDAFVVAPDGSRAGIVWEISKNYGFTQVVPFQAIRWGVWDVKFPFPMTSHDNAKKNLAAMLPDLKTKWADWRHWRKA